MEGERMIRADLAELCPGLLDLETGDHQSGVRRAGNRHDPEAIDIALDQV